ncbi:MAG: response regulator [Leptospiraceae bacterium]|nr:response regulator [Leptospiraceae bacterium]
MTAQFNEILNSVKESENISLENKKNILIIDDNNDVVNSLSIVLNGTYNLILCKSFEEVKSKFNPDIKVCLLDIKMANLNGIDLFPLLKTNYPNLNIIFHSAYPGNESLVERINSLPHSGYLTKGDYNITELLQTINNAF